MQLFQNERSETRLENRGPHSCIKKAPAVLQGLLSSLYDIYFFFLAKIPLCFLACFLGCFLTWVNSVFAEDLDTEFVSAKAPKVNIENASSINTLIFFIIICFCLML